MMIGNLGNVGDHVYHWLYEFLSLISSPSCIHVASYHSLSDYANGWLTAPVRENLFTLIPPFQSPL